MRKIFQDSDLNLIEQMYMHNQFITKLELLLVNIRTFVKMRNVKQLKRGSSIV